MAQSTQMAEITDEQYALADRIAATLESEPERLWTPSALGRKVKAPTSQVWTVLRWMERQVFLTTVGPGAWTKYRARRSGEYGRTAR